MSITSWMWDMDRNQKGDEKAVKDRLENIGPDWPELIRLSQDPSVWKKFIDRYVYTYANKMTIEKFLQLENSGSAAD